jgi:hypothetical protein
MTGVEILEELDALAVTRAPRALFCDWGTREFLRHLLRERLQPRRRWA